MPDPLIPPNSPLNSVIFKAAPKKPPELKPGYTKDPKIFLGIPCGRGSVGHYTVTAALQSVSHTLRVCPLVLGNSSTTHNFTTLYCEAYNNRRRAENPDGFTHFVLLHDDIQPVNPDWLEILYTEMCENQFDVLSAIVAIKDPRGITSTGFDTNLWAPRRLTTYEAHKKLPPTISDRDIPSYFTEGKLEGTGGPLLINTGLMMMRLDQSWNDSVVFQFRNEVFKMPDGRLTPRFEPEDWRFSRFLHRRNAHYGATRKVETLHHGSLAFAGNFSWGEHKWDMINIQDTDEMYGIPRLKDTILPDALACTIPDDAADAPDAPKG